jgi:hypothetical protein
MTFYVLLPLLLVLGIALATQGPVGMGRWGSLGRGAAIVAAVEVLLVGITLALVLVSLDQPREQRCPLEGAEWRTAIVLFFATPIVGGVPLATVIADARRQRGALVWHLLAAPAAVVLPLRRPLGAVLLGTHVHVVTPSQRLSITKCPVRLRGANDE